MLVSSAAHYLYCEHI